VAEASGRLTCNGSRLLKRISLKIGASAAPKKAVLTCLAKGSCLKRAYSQTPATMPQTLSRFLPKSAKPSTRNRAATAAPPMAAPQRQ
jgi:hypothetical protein